jgi:MFS family permease
MGVGIGEAALAPASYSLIADYFPKQRLATALSVFSMAIHLGTGLSFVLGGLVVAFASSGVAANLPGVGAVHAWQLVFLIVGFVPGVLLVLLMYTVKEPVRRACRQAQTAARSASGIPLREVARYFIESKVTLACLILGYTLSALTSYSTWGPALFIRNYGWSAAQTGVVYGSLSSILGILGILAGGRFAEYLARRGHRDANMRVGLICTVAWFPTGILFPLMPTGGWALAMLIPSIFLVSAPWGAAAAALQQAVPDRMRGQASAIYLFVLNLIGLGVGPTAVALLTDYVFHNDHAVGYSLLIVGVISHLIAVLLLWKGLRYFRESLSRAQLWATAHA